MGGCDGFEWVMDVRTVISQRRLHASAAQSSKSVSPCCRQAGHIQDMGVTDSSHCWASCHRCWQAHLAPGRLAAQACELPQSPGLGLKAHTGRQSPVSVSHLVQVLGEVRLKPATQAEQLPLPAASHVRAPGWQLATAHTAGGGRAAVREASERHQPDQHSGAVHDKCMCPLTPRMHALPNLQRACPSCPPPVPLVVPFWRTQRLLTRSNPDWQRPQVALPLMQFV